MGAPFPRCDTCRYWEPPVEGIDDPDWGACVYLIRPDSPLRLTRHLPPAAGDLITHRAFGCAAHRPDVTHDA